MSDNNVLRIEREFKASPEEVYDAWINPQTFVKWWGPEGMTTPKYNLETIEGGHWSATMENAKGDQHTSSGVYTVMDPPNHLAFTWAWSGDDGSRGYETEVDLTFTKTANGTLMVLTQGSFEGKDGRDNHGAGWSSSFNDLDKVLAESAHYTKQN